MSYMKTFLTVRVFNRLGFALFNFKGWQLGEFESIVLDFREDIPTTQISEQVSAIAQQYNVAPQLNSEFSVSDNVYIVKGDRNTLKALKKVQTSQVHRIH